MRLLVVERLAPGELLDAVALAQDRRPAARPGVSRAGTVRPQLDGFFHGVHGNKLPRKPTACQPTGRAGKSDAPLRHPVPRCDGGARGRLAAADLRDRRRSSCTTTRWSGSAGRPAGRGRSCGSTPSSCSSRWRRRPASSTWPARNPERPVHVRRRAHVLRPRPARRSCATARNGATAPSPTSSASCRLSQAFDELDTPGGLCCEPNDLPHDSRHLDMLRAADAHRQAGMGALISGERRATRWR